MLDRTGPVLIAAGLGAMSGMRSMSALALAASRFAPPAAAVVLKVMAVGEMMADKTPFVPDRTEPASIAGRVTFGGLAAGAVAWRMGDSIPVAAAVGAAAAYASTHILYRLRKRMAERTAIPDPVLGAAEDGIVVAVGTQVARLLPA